MGRTINRYWTLSDRPLDPWPGPQTFELREGPIPTPAEGQALTRSIYISLDPYQWIHKHFGEETSGPPCQATTVSQVIESRNPKFAPGDFVFDNNGWSEYGLIDENLPRPSYMNPRKLDPARGKISHALGVLGMPGVTAHVGMAMIGNPKPGETAVVSAAAGGVGQIAGQIARLRGARVVGIAGRPEKCRFVTEKLGFDACVSHLSATFAADLAKACPAGVDINFESVGGAVFDAVLPLFNPGARMALCGIVAHYDHGGVEEVMKSLMQRASARGVKSQFFSVTQYGDSEYEAMMRELAPAVATGRLKYFEDIREGLEIIPAAFDEMLKGGNLGKMLVQVAEDPTRT